MTSLKIGVDVGGTFTHAVAINAETLQIVSDVKVLTTHHASQGVAQGIIDALQKLIEQGNLSIDDIKFIAHSTTQATNAILEGDLSSVGIIAIGTGAEKYSISNQTKVSENYIFIDQHNLTQEKISSAIDDLVNKNVKALIVTEPFSVEKPQNEIKVLNIATTKGIPIVASHEVSGLYGLKIRTQTAFLNASILPKMIEVANFIIQAIKKVNLNLPLMVMRSDGGVMALDEMKKKPLLTMLSGPAAGIAGAIFYEKVSDGIFVEVGGTSTDISVIQNSQAELKSAQIGGHRLYLKTLNVKTIGIGGGSLVTIKNNKISKIGPRSAHILGYKYCAFSKPEEIKNAQLKIDEKKGYLYLKGDNGLNYAITLTCAANYLGEVRQSDYAYGNQESLKIAFSKIEEQFKIDGKILAQQIVDKALLQAEKAIIDFIRMYELKTDQVYLIGGGGGAATVVPALAKKQKINFHLVKEQAQISSIGVALALIQEVVEKNIINPTPEDILKIKEQAEQKVISMGAESQTIESQVEIDRQKNIIRVLATGSLAKEHKLNNSSLGEYEMMKILKKSFGGEVEGINLEVSTGKLDIYSGKVIKEYLFGLFKKKLSPARVINHEGLVKLKINDMIKIVDQKGKIVQKVKEYIDNELKFSDVGVEFLPTYLIYGSRMVNLSKLGDFDHMFLILEQEIAKIDESQNIIVLIDKD